MKHFVQFSNVTIAMHINNKYLCYSM